MRYIQYGEKHMEIVLSGIDSISEVLKSSDDAEKASLLLCLDRYLDPWYGYNLPYVDEIFKLLEYFIISPNDKNLKQDALHLLTGYASSPFTVLENNLDKIEPELIEEVQDAIKDISNFT